MGPKEKQALLELESWCRENANMLRSMILEMHLLKVERARVSDLIDDIEEKK